MEQSLPMMEQSIIAAPVPAHSMEGYYPTGTYAPQASVGRPGPQALIYQDTDDDFGMTSRYDNSLYGYGYGPVSGYGTYANLAFYQNPY